MSEATESPYKSPSANLVDQNSDGSIFKFKRFTAWGVFGLSIITLGIYPIYWLCNRASIANTIHQDQISVGWMAVLVGATILNFVSGFFGDDFAAALAALAISLAYLVSYLVVLFKLKNRLEDIMTNSASSVYKLNPILAFFFSAIYLQYKINQCIDDLS